MRPVSIILKKTQGKAQLQWPNGTPKPYQVLPIPQPSHCCCVLGPTRVRERAAGIGSAPPPPSHYMVSNRPLNQLLSR